MTTPNWIRARDWIWYQPHSIPFLCPLFCAFLMLLPLHLQLHVHLLLHIHIYIYIYAPVSIPTCTTSKLAHSSSIVFTSLFPLPFLIKSKPHQCQQKWILFLLRPSSTLNVTFAFYAHIATFVGLLSLSLPNNINVLLLNKNEVKSNLNWV